MYNEWQSDFKQPVKRCLTAANKTKSMELLYSISPEVHSSVQCTILFTCVKYL